MFAEKERCEKESTQKKLQGMFILKVDESFCQILGL